MLFFILGYKAAYEGRAIINLQMGNTFGAFLDINQALKVCNPFSHEICWGPVLVLAIVFALYHYPLIQLCWIAKGQFRC